MPKTDLDHARQAIQIALEYASRRLEMPIECLLEEIRDDLAEAAMPAYLHGVDAAYRELDAAVVREIRSMPDVDDDGVPISKDWLERRPNADAHGFSP